ncbi:MAG TPA: hypothetical protein PLV12_03360, partial [Saprospiraceae bacterium]|nr:hypothetical protein [Saprospiraceae bacterium]
MPLVLEKILDPGTRLGVWLATEGDDFFEQGILLHETEKEEIAKLQARKKSEWLDYLDVDACSMICNYG